MKLTWKKTSGYKRDRALVSSYPNLPFEAQTKQEPDPQVEEDDERSNKRKSGKGEYSSETLDPLAQNPDHSDRYLAETFESQGNQLAEVIPIPWACIGSIDLVSDPVFHHLILILF